MEPLLDRHCVIVGDADETGVTSMGGYTGSRGGVVGIGGVVVVLEVRLLVLGV